MHADNATVDPRIMVMTVDTNIARRLKENQQRFLFSSIFTECPKSGQFVGPGDRVEVTVWETPPGALFSNPMAVAGGASPNLAPMIFPEQEVSVEGTISVPFAGHIKVAGLSLQQIEQEVCNRLKGKANDPQVVVRLLKNTSSTVTVVGEVTTSCVLPLSPKCERILDVLAAAGGGKQAVNKQMVQLTRAGKVHSVPLESVIKDNNENLIVQPGDVITLLFQPNSFTALGATGRNAEIEFEATGITLAQALARAGGVMDDRADVRGAFLFRFEPVDALEWPRKPEAVTPDNTVPVVYNADLSDPATFFAAQSFPIKNGDILYIATAPSVQLTKFLTMIGTITNPSLGALQNVRTMTKTNAWE